MEHVALPVGDPDNRQQKDVREGVEDQKEKKELVLLHILRRSPGIKDREDRALPALPGDVTCTANVMNTPASIICGCRVYIETTPTTPYCVQEGSRDDQKDCHQFLSIFSIKARQAFFFNARNGKTNRKR